MKDVKYIYIGNEANAKHKGIIAIGYRYTDTTIQYAVAFCSKNDRFNKSISRTIITGRMDAGMIMEIRKDTDSNTYRFIKMSAISALKGYHEKFAGVNVPSWAENIIRGL